MPRRPGSAGGRSGSPVPTRAAPWLRVLAVLVLAALGGCAALVRPVVNNAADNLSAAILDQDDPETVRDGAPAYLLLMDSLVRGSPGDATTLQAAARLYAAYAAIFVEDPARAGRLSAHALDYAARGLCQVDRAGCGIRDLAFDSLASRTDDLGQRAVPALYTLALSWLVYIRAHSEDWQALADLPKVQLLLERLLALDETYERGSVHTFMGVLLTLRPPALGGEPEAARRHFERAIELSGGRDLGVKVEYARSYARLLYDRALHDTLLHEVLEADPRTSGLTLTNVLAQRRARELLATADDYF